jgi:dipeptidyl aminopeptidase/acylaminoacyl peptidase
MKMPSWMSLACRVAVRTGAPRLTLLLAGLAVLGPAMTAGAWASTVPARRLLEVTDLGNPVMSPDGRRVAFRAEMPSVERNTVETAWYVQALDGRAPPLRVGEGGLPLRELVSGVVLPSPAVWSPDGRWIYYRASLDGRVSVWRAAADGSAAQEVTTDPADVRAFALAEDGRMLRYSTGATREQVAATELAEYDRGVHIDRTVNMAAAVFRSGNANGRPATQRFTGGWFAAGPLLAGEPDHWKGVDLDAMDTRALPAGQVPRPPLGPGDLHKALPAPTRLAVNPDGRIALLTDAARQAGQQVSRYRTLSMLADRHARRPLRCVHPRCADRYITDLLWRPGSDEVVFTSTNFEKGRAQEIHAWNVATGAVRPVVLSQGLLSGSQRYWDIPCAISAHALVCVAAEADRPPRLEAIDLDSGQRRVLYAPNAALESDIAAVAPAQFMQWRDAQGRGFTGYLFPARRPVADTPPPLFVTFYNCYGFLRGGMGDEWPLVSLAEQGISSLCINALPGFPNDFVERHDPARTAIESVVALLAGQGKIDPARVGMGGLSYGGEVTLWTLAHSDVVRVASVSSISLTPSYYLYNSLSDEVRSTVMERWQLGDPDATPAQWARISPVHHLDRIRAPILFQQPEQEYRLALDYVLPLMRRKQADMYVFPDELHIKFQPRHKLAVYDRNLDWFRFWLQGHEDADPLKAGQYRVWEEMRPSHGGPALVGQTSGPP